MATHRLNFERRDFGELHASEVELYQNGVDNFTLLIRNNIGDCPLGSRAILTKADMLEISDMLRQEALRPER